MSAPSQPKRIVNKTFEIVTTPYTVKGMPVKAKTHLINGAFLKTHYDRAERCSYIQVLAANGKTVLFEVCKDVVEYWREVEERAELKVLRG